MDQDGDRRITFTEFICAKNTLERWGIDMSAPEEVWNEVNSNGGSMVLFDEFCEWAVSKNLDIEDDDDDEL